MNRLTKFLLLIIILVSLFLRLYKIDTDLLFHYDQGLHAIGIWNIWKEHHFPLLGHPTDVEGVYHGAFFYYFMAPVYALSQGDPVGASVFMVFLDVAAIFFLFKAAKILFKSELVGLVAATVWGFSFLAVSYSRWLSNVTPISFFVILFYYFISKIELQKKKSFWPLGTLTAGIIVQLNGAIGFFFIPLILILAFMDRKIFFKRRKLGLVSLVLFFLPSLPLIFFDLRHQFLVSKSIIKMVLSPGGLGFSLKIAGSFSVFLRELVNFFSFENFLFAGVIIAGTLFGMYLLLKKKEKGTRLLVLLLAVPLVGLLLYKRGTADFFYLGILPLIALTFARSLSYFFKNPITRVLALIVLLIFARDNLKNDLHYFGEQTHALIPIGTNSLITLDDRKKAVDFIYSKAQGKPFGLWIYTIPYYKDEPWDYVFMWYGKGKYGYLPSENAEKLMFDLWERDPNEGYRLDAWKVDANKKLGIVVGAEKYHDVNVEERLK